MLQATSSAGRVAAAVPITLLCLFVGLLWLVGLACGKDRRQYVTKISEQAMRAINAIWCDSPHAEPSAPASSLQATTPDTVVPLASRADNYRP
jgi:hypothetical protein